MSAAAVGSPDTADAIARERTAEISTAMHRVDMANIQRTLQRIEQESLTETAISRIGRIFRWASLFISVTSSIAAVVRLYWNFSHPASHFDLLLLCAIDAVSSFSFAATYATDHRRRKGRPASHAFPLPGAAEAPGRLLDGRL